MKPMVEIPLASQLIPSNQLIAFINPTNQSTVNITTMLHGNDRVICALITNSWILTHHTHNAINPAIT